MRRVLFLAILSWIVITPFLRHVVGVHTKILRDWGMMGTAGLPLREARFFQVRDGKWREIDYSAQLPPRRVTRPHAATLNTDDDVHALGRRLCAQLGPDTDVRAVSRLGMRNGWVPERRGERNLCVP